MKKYGVVSLFVVLFFLPKSVSAIGISPGTIVLDNILPTVAITKEIGIFRQNASSSILLDISVDGSGKNFIKLSQTKVPMDIGVHKITYDVIIDPKKALLNTPYEANVRFKAQTAKKNNGTGLTPSLVLMTRIGFSVTNTVINNLQINGFGPDHKKNASAANRGASYFYVLAENNGNSVPDISRAEINIYDKKSGKLIMNKDIDKKYIRDTDPKTSVYWFVDADLSPGVYKIDLIVYNGDGSILTKKNTVYEIEEYRKSFRFIYYSIALIFILFICLFFFIKYFKNHYRSL